MRSVEYTDENGVEISVETYGAGYMDDGFSVYFKDQYGDWIEVFSNPCYISWDCDPSDDMLREWAEEILADSEEYSAALAGTL
jgi:hypothetical protein